MLIRPRSLSLTATVRLFLRASTTSSVTENIPTKTFQTIDSNIVRAKISMENQKHTQPAAGMSPEMLNIKEKAEKHCISFAAAMALPDTNPAATTTDIANALFNHYQPIGFTAFSLGIKRQLGTRDHVVPAMTEYLDKCLIQCLGLNVRMESYRVRPFSPTSALCYLSWRYFPPRGSLIKSWAWESLYLFRLSRENDKGYWEFCLTDNEMSGMLERFPGFYDPLKQATWC